MVCVYTNIRVVTDHFNEVECLLKVTYIKQVEIDWKLCKIDISRLLHISISQPV